MDVHSVVVDLMMMVVMMTLYQVYVVAVVVVVEAVMLNFVVHLYVKFDKENQYNVLLILMFEFLIIYPMVMLE
jgi:hypothetical protein